MITTVTTYTCDKCKKDVPNGAKFYRLAEESVSTVNTEQATRSIPFTNGVYFNTFDSPAIHLCKECKDGIMNITVNPDSSFYARGIT